MSTPDTRRQSKALSNPVKSGTAEKSRTSAAPETIFLFIPNLIASLYYMPLHPRTCSLLYSISCLLDAADGFAARKFNQSTRFGAVLDMVIDRCTTSCLLVFLASAFPRWSIIFQSLISLDLASHYVHMYATLAMGGKEQSHKVMGDGMPWVMKLYYTDKNVLFTVCAMNEVFFIALYLLSFSSPTFMPSLIQPDGELSSLKASTPITSSLIWTTPWSAGAMEMARANKMDSTGPWILLVVSCLFMCFKQVVNVVQLVEASKRLAEGDIEMRKKAGLPRRKMQ